MFHLHVTSFVTVMLNTLRGSLHHSDLAFYNRFIHIRKIQFWNSFWSPRNCILFDSFLGISNSNFSCLVSEFISLKLSSQNHFWKFVLELYHCMSYTVCLSPFSLKIMPRENALLKRSSDFYQIVFYMIHFYQFIFFFHHPFDEKFMKNSKFSSEKSI